MPHNAAELAHLLAREAEAVCRHYLSNGRRVGNYWQVGDVRNTSGRSMFVRLKPKGPGGRPAGKWMDAATAEHGDLLDVIRESCGLVDFHDVTTEARRFLSLPRSEPVSEYRPRTSLAPTGSPESARRLFAMSKPIEGTVVETYLRGRGITEFHLVGNLRFHPRCYYRPEVDAPTEIWPAMIAAVTDLQGHITGAHRTWLDPSGRDKAPVDTPRRAMGHLLGHAVRFGPPSDVMAAGEGIETILSLRSVMPGMPMVAALSAAHLGAILFPKALRRLYIARDDDRAGEDAMRGLISRTQMAGIAAIVLSPQCGGDFNEDLRNSDTNALRAALRAQLAPEDMDRFLGTRVWTGIGDEAGTPP
jgi:Toprim domain